MDNKKAYIKVDVKNELPKKAGKYFTDYETTMLIYNESGFWEYKYEEKHLFLTNPEPCWWLKEVNIVEIMMEFPEWILKNHFNNAYILKGLHPKPSNYAAYLHQEDLLNEFLTSKGIQL